jgi:hypothetical protein
MNSKRVSHKFKFAFSVCLLAVFACDTEEESQDQVLNLEFEEQQELDYSAHAEPGNLQPFAEFEREGHRVRFFLIGEESGDVVVEESSLDAESGPLYIGAGRSPLEIYWLVAPAGSEIPDTLIANYEANFGDFDTFLVNHAATRGTGVAQVTDITTRPQAAKWWFGGGCIPNNDYNFATCFDGWTIGGSHSCHNTANSCGHDPFRYDGPVLYSILRDTADIDREVIVYWDGDTSGYCDYTNSFTLAEGSFAGYEYTQSSNWSWYARIEGGCANCYEFRSIFMYDATQTSTCLANPG